MVAGIFVAVWAIMRLAQHYAVWVFLFFLWAMSISQFLMIRRLSWVVWALTPPPSSHDDCEGIAAAVASEAAGIDGASIQQSSGGHGHSHGSEHHGPRRGLWKRAAELVLGEGGNATLRSLKEPLVAAAAPTLEKDGSFSLTSPLSQLSVQPPPYTTHDAPKPRPPGLFKWLLGPIVGDKHRALFWGGAKGAHLLLRMFRVRLLLTCAALAFVLSFYSSRMWHVSPVLPFAAILPLILVSLLTPGEIVRFAVATSIERMIDDDVVRSVLRKQKTLKGMKLLRLLATLKTFMRKAEPSVKCPGQERHPPKTSPENKALSVQAQEYLRMLKEVFDSFDEDGGGTISRAEFKQMMVVLGQQLSDAEADELFDEMDLDRSDSVDWDEMKEVLLEHYEASRASKQEPKELAASLWRMFDADGSGSIDVNELLEVLKRTSKGWNVEDVVQMFNEIDLDRSGSIEKHEFEEFVMANAAAL